MSGHRHGLDLSPRTRIVVVLAWVVVCVSTPPQRYAAFAGYLLGIWLFAALLRVSLRRVWRRALVALPFLLMLTLFLPFLPEDRPGGSFSVSAADASELLFSSYRLTVLWNSLIKAATGSLALVVLGAATPFPELLHGLDHLRVPRLLLTLLAVTHRYGQVFSDELLRTRRALAARGFRPRNLSQAAVLGGLLGGFFLRAYERGERVYLAMVSRGFDGAFPVRPHGRHSWDLAFTLAAMVVLGLLRWGTP